MFAHALGLAPLSLVVVLSLLLPTPNAHAADDGSDMDASFRCLDKDGKRQKGYYYTNYRRRTNPSKGGFVSNEASVEDNDSVFIGPEVSICGSSNIEGSVRIYGKAFVDNSTVSDRSDVSGDARVIDGAIVEGNAKIRDKATIRGTVRVSGNAVVSGDAHVYNFGTGDLATVTEDARVTGGEVSDNAIIGGKARIQDKARVSGNATVNGTAVLGGFTRLNTGTVSSGVRNDPDFAGIEKAKKEAQEKATKAAAATASNAEKAKQLRSERDGLRRSTKDASDKLTTVEVLGNMYQGRLEYSFPNLCQFTVKQKRFSRSSGGKTFNLITEADLHLEEPIEFVDRSYEDGGSKQPCLKLDLSALNASSMTKYSEKDEYTDRTVDHRDILCMPSSMIMASAVPQAIKLFKQMQNACKRMDQLNTDIHDLTGQWE